ncbi:transcription antitermination factor NusB [Salinibacterium sp. G-O1]|uniref:RsmB/NOP family class I SAM-dependent RNA methyltransferase n=1 Tax=Salinibacterium sp. G-O1 TaxID=3046208 RepID=UPI0024B93FA0|nr:transcription antitermination factor NusB [Salinibacterium sp. G-O1]MDJ0335178.1 transcription antitermination factor NusB [Salinibacterium sp. G-O1]
MSQPQPARRIALDVIMAVRDSDAYANLLLPVRLGRAKLSEADAGLATELTYGTLRMQGYYDRVIAMAANRSTDKIDPAVLDVLRLACHQLLSMRVAQHAAVDESVELAKTVGSNSAVGFVNGVLRTITRTDADTWRERVLAEAESGEEALAFEFSHPLWVTRAFRQVLVAEGREDELEGALAADNVAPRVSIAALPDESTVDELDAYPAAFSPVGAILDHGDPLNLPAVREGRARVQDEGSQLAALTLSRARPIRAGEQWLDLCAGPGGKAALLAAEALAGGAILTANELVPARAELVRKALNVFDAPPEVWELDGTEIGALCPNSFDRILLDAPCTGLGALRRRPEARWRKQPSDVAGLGNLQAKLLKSAIAALKPGGVLAYVTCSPHAAETKAIVTSVLRKADNVERMDTPAVLQSIVKEPLDLPDATHVQLWPHRHGTDGMFIQLLAKA